ncbi:MAG: glycine dehydrogenase (aminomethyl-transferring) [Deltaproteobacteria bacterium]|nr:MAG: glycine dehydrogenase (aminomethyl-transferring) [Deltaproteobacteria bacterium]
MPPTRTPAQTMKASELLGASDAFASRHIGPRDADHALMLDAIGVPSLAALVDQAVPTGIRLQADLDIPAARTEAEALAELRDIAARNVVRRSFLGMGYHATHTPPVLLRNIMENPGWYTQYTPYQAEISQGRLEALLNFQTMISDLSGLPLSNASLLDEATAAAEAVGMAFAHARQKRRRVLVAADVHPQTLAVVQTRAEPLGIAVETFVPGEDTIAGDDLCAVLVQVPATDGTIHAPEPLVEAAHAAGALFIAAADLLSLTVLRAPGSYGADIAVGSSQRFGVPLGYGGPHAGWIATSDRHARLMPGRLIGVSRDAAGNPAMRLALQTREQHIRRDRATSNICTAQVLLAIMASMYAVYHGPDGLKRIARRVQALAATLREGLRRMGHDVPAGPLFDTMRVRPRGVDGATIASRLDDAGFNLRRFEDESWGIALDEPTTLAEVQTLLGVFAVADAVPDARVVSTEVTVELPEHLRRDSAFLAHDVFHAHRSETEMLRYLHRLQGRDLSLTRSMIPLGSCTMKLNATAEMIPVTWSGFADLHPFAPVDQTTGYRQLFRDLEGWLSEITGFEAVSLQPNAGSQGEYAGLLVIRAWHQSRGDAARDVCLIPTSAHGTNPASAVLAGFRVVPVKCDEDGNIDLEDLRTQAEKHADRLGALMITYPSTHGVFEAHVREVCAVVHAHGGQVYMDGANMNAQVGLCSPGDIGADVCHLNLHKTFCIPHGGGGPGMGPIGVAAHLAPFLPGHPVVETGGEQGIGAISAAPWGSPSILPISWAYIRMMGASGLRRATEVAILNANYMAARLEPHFDILYRGESGRVAHEFVIDCRPFRASAGVEVEDIAKRLMDYGFHAPTMSWPVPGTLMIEPTESEGLAELDRFCEAMIAIREEIRDVAEGRLDREDNPLKNAPHTAAEVTAEDWTHGYSRERAAWPLPWVKVDKFWPSVARVDNAYGDRNLVCTCLPMDAYGESQDA